MALELVGTVHKYIGTAKKSIFAILLDETYRLYEEAGLDQDALDSVLPANTVMWSAGASINDVQVQKWLLQIEDWNIDKIDDDLEDIPLAGTAQVRDIVERILLREKALSQFNQDT